MIRINLLPVKRRRKALPLKAVIVPSAVIAAVTILVLTIATFYINSNISALKDQKAVKEKRLNELKKVLKIVEGYERDNEAFRIKNETIEKLKKKQSMPLRLLDEVSEMLPKGVWLTGLTDTGGIISVKGYAFTNPDLVNYVQNLKSSKYITDVALLESRQTNVQDFSIYQFKLTFRMKV